MPHAQQSKRSRVLLMQALRRVPSRERSVLASPAAVRSFAVGVLAVVLLAFPLAQSIMARDVATVAVRGQSL